MKACRPALLLSLLVLAAGIAAGQTTGEVELRVSETEITAGDTLRAYVDTSDANVSEPRFRFLLGDQEIERTGEDTLSYEVTDEDVSEERSPLTARVTDAEGDPVGHDSVELSYLSPVGNYELSVTPKKVEPGETVEARVTLDGETVESARYEWRLGPVKAEDEPVSSGPAVEFETRRVVHGDSGRISVDVFNQEGRRIGADSAEIIWDRYDAGVEGLDVDYGDGRVEIAVSGERLERRPEIRLGNSIESWSSVRLLERRRSGDAVLTLEEVEADGTDLNVNSVVEISGQNIEGLGIKATAQVSREWLEENDLLLSPDKAYVSFYETDGWEKLSTYQGHGRLEDYLQLETEEGYLIEGEPATLAIAGREGMDFGRYGIGPRGQCEELDEEEPLPPGWEEIEVDCQLHESAERFDDSINEFVDRFERERGELPERFRERFEDIREAIDDYRLAEAREMRQELGQDISEWQREQRYRGEERAGSAPASPENRTRQELRELNLEERLPEGVSQVYNRSDRLEELFREAETQIEEGDYGDASQTMGEIRSEQRQIEGAERAREVLRLLERIEQMKESEGLENESLEKLERAESLIREEGDIEAAREMVNEVEEEIRMNRAADFLRRLLQDEEIRQMIRNIVADILPV